MNVAHIPDVILRAIRSLVGVYYVGATRVVLDFASINAGLQQRLTVTVAGAEFGDYVDTAPESDAGAGLALAQSFVSAADTVTVTMVNNTAGAIDPASTTFRVRVTRESRR